MGLGWPVGREWFILSGLRRMQEGNCKDERYVVERSFHFDGKFAATPAATMSGMESDPPSFYVHGTKPISDVNL